MKNVDVVIVGAGMSGLSCALMCHRKGLSYKIIEKSNRLGGRIGSIKENGYIYDIGFQVYNTSYKKSNSILNTNELDLCYFRPGAAIHDGKNFKIISDPFRDFSRIVSTIKCDLLNIRDKIKIFKLKMSLKNYTISKDKSQDISTIAYLKKYGFSKKAIKNFFVPFFSGIFLEKDLETSSKFFKFVFSKFNGGYAAIPSYGMQAIPNQIYDRLNQDSILFDRELVELKNSNSLILNDNSVIESQNLVLTGDSCGIRDNRLIDYNSSTTIYFSSKVAPPMDRYIHLFPKDGIINNISILTAISQKYSSKKDHLYSITILDDYNDDSKLISKIKISLKKYYGGDISDFKFLKRFTIKKATIKQKTGFFDIKKPTDTDLIFAGDQFTNGSIEGAVDSGINAAKDVINNL